MRVGTHPRWLLATALAAACADPPAAPVDAAVTDQSAVIDRSDPPDITVDAGVDAPAPIDRLPMDAGADLGVDVPVVIDAPTVDVPPLCVPGRSERCTCGDGAVGARTCDDRGAYGECRCVMGDGGAWDPPLVLPPRLIAPRSVSRATTQRPTFRWVMPEGMTRARITLARDRALTREVRSTVVEGARWRPTELLPHAVWFWRVEALAADNRVVWTSATWEFQSPWRDTAVDSSWGPIWDTNGDGYDDLVMEIGFRLAVLQGAPSLSGIIVRSVPRTSERHDVYEESASVGDFNGDGIADVAVPLVGADATLRSEVLVYYGTPTGIGPAPGRRLVQPSERRLSAIWGGAVSSADWNGDGYGDLVVSHACGRAGGCADNLPGVADVYLGSSSGISDEPSVQVGDPRFIPVGYYRSVGDVNDDGYGDLAGLFGPSELTGGSVILGGPASVAREVELYPARAYSAARVSAVGDINGDGQPDFIVGGYDVVTIYSGEPGWPILRRMEAPDRPTSYGPGNFGVHIGCAGDIDGDGMSETLLAAPLVPLQPSFGYGPGRVYIYRGSSESASPELLGTISGSALGQSFGNESVGCVDLDGDGRNELYVGDRSLLPPQIFGVDSEGNLVRVPLPFREEPMINYQLFRVLACAPRSEPVRG